jgi:hypothetical protein
MCGIEKFRMAESADGALTLVRTDYSLPECDLVQALSCLAQHVGAP